MLNQIMITHNHGNLIRKKTLLNPKFPPRMTHRNSMLVCAIPTDGIVRTISGKLFRRGRPAHVLHRGVQLGRVGKVLRRNPQQQTPVDAFLADVRQGTIDVIHTERLDRHGHQRRTAVANFRQERLQEEAKSKLQLGHISTR